MTFLVMEVDHVMLYTCRWDGQDNIIKLQCYYYMRLVLCYKIKYIATAKIIKWVCGGTHLAMYKSTKEN